MIHAADAPPGEWAVDLEAWPVATADQSLRAPASSCTRALLVVSDALVALGWLDGPAATGLLERASAHQLSLVAVRQAAAPCETLPTWITLVAEGDAPAAVEALARGELPDVPRPRTARVSDAPARWAELAVRVHRGESPEVARQALELPGGAVPGAFFAPDLRLLEPVGTDSACSRWAAEDGQGRAVTVALVHGHLADRFGRVQPALEKWAELAHPRVQAVHGMGVRDGSPWVAWWSAPRTLEGEIVASMGSDHALLAVLDVAEAVEHAHAHGCVHGVPAPCWVGLDGSGARLGGFGLGALLRGSQEVLLFTAPELLDPSAPATAAGDVYAVGMLVLLALYGDTLPYWVLRDTSRLLRQLDPEPELAAALRKALEWSPAARARSVREMVDALLADTGRVERLARAALEDGLLDQAERLVQRLDHLTGDPRHQQGLRLDLARRRASRGAPDDAIRSLVILAERSADAAPIWLEIAEVYRQQGRPDDATSAARRAWSEHRDRSSAEVALRTLIQVDRSNVEGWVEELLPFVDDHERTELVLRVVAQREEAGDVEGALAWLERVDDEELEARRRDLRTALGDPDARVAALLEEAESLSGDARQSRLDEALRLAIHDADARLEVCQALVASPEPHAVARRILARDAMERGSVGEALEHYELLCAWGSSTSADHMAHARGLAEAGHTGEALEAVASALEREPDHAAALRLGASLAARAGRPGQAAAWLARWLQLHDDGSTSHLDVHLDVAGWFRRARQHEHAARHYRLVLERSPGDARAVWGLRLLDPDAEATALPVGPHEALAALLVPLLDVRATLPLLDRGGRAAEGADPWRVALDLVDLMSTLGAIQPALFELLFTRLPNWADPVAAVFASWSGEEGGATAAEVARWRGKPGHGARRRTLPAARRFGTGSRSFDLGALLLGEVGDPPRSSQPGEQAGAPVLVIGVGPERRVVPVPDSCVLTPTTVPGLPGMLQVYRTPGQTYLAVDEGTLKREGDYAQEVRAVEGERITWRGVPIQLLAEAPPEPRVELPVFEEAPEERTEPRPRVELLRPGPVARLADDEPALVWEDGGLLRALGVPAGVCSAFQPEVGKVAFAKGEQPGSLARFERDGDTVEVVIQGERRRLVARDEVTLGGVVITFHQRGQHASPADSPTVEMEGPTPAPPPWLLLDDGTASGRPVRVSTSPFRLGRAKECELYLKDDPMLSRVHCQLERVDGQWFAVDRESANGTRVNGLHVSGRSLLEEGDRVEIGRTLLLFTRHTPAVPEPAETIEELEPDDEEEDTRPVSTEEVQAAQRRVAATVLTANEAARMVGVVNKALSVIFRALDDVHGAGSGRAELQQLVDHARPPSLVSGLSIQGPELPVEAIVTRLDARPGAERRSHLEAELLRMVDAASTSVCARLPAERAEEVGALLEAVDFRRRLRL
ncbi:MAG: FHA domain-containing protein [Alphaproteobacteria bacterium]|nr:FHA domain-containing protein [Alphaproteobacteria bacterium]